MKKNVLSLFVLGLFSVLTSCSNGDDNNITSNKGYAEVTLFGETHRHEFEEGNTISWGANSCDAKIELRNQGVAQFEKSNYFLDIGFVHKENQQQFKGYDINTTAVKPYLDFSSTTCNNNFDFLISYEDYTNNNKSLAINTSSNNYNKIVEISVFRETTEEIIYAVKGNFEVDFKKSDNSLIPVKGNYKTFIYVLK